MQKHSAKNKEWHLNYFSARYFGLRKSDSKINTVYHMSRWTKAILQQQEILILPIFFSNRSMKKKRFIERESIQYEKHRFLNLPQYFSVCIAQHPSSYDQFTFDCNSWWNITKVSKKKCFFLLFIQSVRSIQINFFIERCRFQ